MSEIVVFTPENPVAVLSDEKKYSEFYERIAKEVRAHVPDITTAKGRAEIKSLAFKVTRTKTALDDAGKKLNEDARAKINAVDAQRRKIREELDTLAAEVRQPLTEWEQIEADRIGKANEILGLLSAPINMASRPSEHVANAIRDFEEMTLDPDVLQEGMEMAVRMKGNVLDVLRTEHASALQREADAAELARLRAEKEEYARLEQERIDREANEKAQRETEERAAREAAEKLEREKAEQIERDRKAQEDRDRAIEEARQAERREAQAKIDAAERTAKEAQEKADHENQVREAEAKRLADEQAKRDADRTHRGKVMGSVKTALMTCGADEETAKKIVLAIVAGEIPQTRITF